MHNEITNLYTALAQAVATGDRMVIDITIGQVLERLKVLSEHSENIINDKQKP